MLHLEQSSNYAIYIDLNMLLNVKVVDVNLELLILMSFIHYFNQILFQIDR